MSAKPQEKEKPKNPWKEYERRKAELPEGLSADEYQAACKRIADELGI